MQTGENPDTHSAAGPTAGRAGLVTCWSCKGPAGSGDLFCPTCRAVQPPGQADHFARLGLPATFDIDQAALDRRYFDLQRILHPDRFVNSTPRERTLSQQQAVSLNEAYEVLKDPLSRADYMVRLKGTEVLPEGCNLVNDEELLVESMELRQALAEAETVGEVDVLARRAADDIGACIEQLSALFAGDDLEGAIRLTTRLKYLRKLAEETRLGRARLANTPV